MRPPVTLEPDRSLARPLDTEIIRFIIDNVASRPDDIGPFTARRFGVTRATASNYLRRLVEAGQLSAWGRTRARTYALKPSLLVSGISQLRPDTEDDEVWRRDLRPRLDGLPRAVVEACQFGFTAAVANAVDHSGADSFAWRLRLDARSVEISVSDAGQGVFARLRAGLGLHDDRTALLALAKGGATTDPGRRQGRSLFLASQLFDGFRLASGRLAYVRGRGGDGLAVPRVETLASPVSGAHLALRLDIATARPPAEVFADLVGQDGRPRAEVPVALAGALDEPLTSRSQARRLTAGLERFCEARLDFHGAPGVGPAFIHEIFAVFAKAHPDLRLTAERARPDVADMIAQALAA